MKKNSPHLGVHRRSTSKKHTFRRKAKKPTIHHSKFIKAASTREAEVIAPVHAFQDFALHSTLKDNLERSEYITPTPIQDKAIPEALQGKDIIGIAQTGTGKTIAFALPVLHRLMTDPMAQALIMAPTRELALQIDSECRTVAAGSGLLSAVLIGGAPINRQLAILRHKPRIIIGTPGRIKDHLERGSLQLDTINLVVLDEVDRMLDMGFVDDMRTILGRTASKRQSLYFSATMTPQVDTLIREFTHNPTTISVTSGTTSDLVEQDVVHFSGRDQKIEKLHDLLITDTSQKTLVFGETKYGVERLGKALAQRGFKTDAIHGGKSQGARQRALRKFKENEISVLVATDVAARGIDVSDVTHVINYDVPQTYDDYVHRIGRAGRAGKKGFAFTLVEKNSLR
jgi:superfamily II DNA/RNA helicase